NTPPPVGGGLIAPTSTTCSDFTSGTAQHEAQITYTLQNGVIHNAAPGVIFYYSKVTAPASSFTITIQQTNSSSNGTPFFDVQQGNQVTLYNADCSNSSLGTLQSTTNGQVTLSVSGATAGQVFVVGVKYSPKSVVGAPAPAPPTVHYDFVTKVNRTPVATDPLGID